MTVVSDFLEGLRANLGLKGLAQLDRAEGAREQDLEPVLQRYPQCPSALLELLRAVDGTHFREYPTGEVVLLMLGSDVGTYPYYLRSSADILEDERLYRDSIREIYQTYLDEDPELLGAGIDADVSMADRLCFSHCMNNGGTSRLYIDFSPTVDGVSGQVIRFLHDPDSYVVIAADFEQYLHQLIDGGYEFLDED